MKKLLFPLLLLGFFFSLQGQTRLYVKASDGNNAYDGYSWDKAVQSLDTALNRASENTGIKEIWVAKGTYYASQKANDTLVNGAPSSLRDRAFVLPSNIKLYGGFEGTETNINQRVLVLGEQWKTILSGANTNCYHVIIAIIPQGSSLLVDGFQIEKGMANGVTNLLVHDSVINPKYGGGVYAMGGAQTWSNNSIIQNTASELGSGVYISNGSHIWRNNKISSNTSQLHGGGVYITGGIGVQMWVGNTFYNNSAIQNGGAISTSGVQTYQWTNNTIIKNSAAYGGGIHLTLSAAHIQTWSNNTFMDNTATVNGGGIYLTGTSATCKINNSFVFGNKKTGVINSIEKGAGAIKVSLNYCMIEGFTKVNADNFGSTGSGNLNGDVVSNPKVHHDSIFMGYFRGNFHLKPLSMLINQGNNAYVTGVTDYEGKNRIQEGTVDLGALEYAPPKTYAGHILYVKKGNFIGLQDGSSWTHAFPELSDAIEYANYLNSIKLDSVEQIWVAKGTYLPLYTVNGGTERDRTFMLNVNIKYYGGFEGNETELSRRSMAPSGKGSNGKTILSGNLNDQSLNTDNAYHVIIANIPVGRFLEIDGFTIKDGKANGAGVMNAIDQYNGGGAFLAGDGKQTWSHNTFIENNTSTNGGGVYAVGIGSHIFSNNLFVSNIAIGNGGGVHLIAGKQLWTGNSLIHNRAVIGGGMYAAGNDTLIFFNNVLTHNEAIIGAGVYENSNNVHLWMNTILAQNKSTNMGGGAYIEGTGKRTWTNNTITMNTALNDGGGVYVGTGAGISTLNNTLVWANKKTAGGVSPNNISASAVTVLNSCLVEGFSSSNANSIGAGTGTANLEGSVANPRAHTDSLFMGLTLGNYHLKAGSMGIDQGNDSYVSSENQYDLDGKPRMIGQVDLGAFEFTSPKTDTNHTLYVKSEITQGILQNGSSWVHAFPELSDAIAAAHYLNDIKADSVQQIWVAKGIYSPLYKAADSIFNAGVIMGPAITEDQTFVLPANVNILGGFSGVETKVSERTNPMGTISCLSGQINSDRNVYHIMIAAGETGTARLDGFTLTGGIANGSNRYIKIHGEPVYQNNGGGIYCEKSSPVLSNLQIYGNQADEDGGGIFTNNRSSPVLNNILLVGNEAKRGGGIANKFSEPIIIHSTIVQNRGRFGSGIFNMDSSNIQLYNSIVWNNNAVGEDMFNDQSKPQYHACLIGGLPVVGGIIANTNPLFIDADMGNYRLSVKSPVIDKGGKTPVIPEVDLEGKNRIIHGKTGELNGNADLGAYEYRWGSVSVIDKYICNGQSQPIQLKDIPATMVNNYTVRYNYSNVGPDTGFYIRNLMLIPKDYQADSLLLEEIIEMKSNPRADLDSIFIDNKNFPLTGDTIYYIVDCDKEIKSLPVTLFLPYGAALSGVSGSSFTVSVPLSGKKEITEFLVTSQSKGNKLLYVLIVENPYTFESVVENLWNNTFMLNLKKLKEDGHTPTAYQWYKNETPIPDAVKSIYSAGPKRENLLESNAAYAVNITQANGNVIHTCYKKFTPKPNHTKTYPNPVKAGGIITIELEEGNWEGAQVDIYNALGKQVYKSILNNSKVSTPLEMGIYIIKLVNTNGETTEFKILVN